jgi:hypothetical protein
MTPEITICLLYIDPEQVSQSIQVFKNCGLPVQIVLLVENNQDAGSALKGYITITISSLFSTDTVLAIAARVKTRYVIVCMKKSPVIPGALALHRFFQVAEDTGAGIVYSDYFAIKANESLANPLIDFQEGSLRDDFNFGSLILYRTSALAEAAARMRDQFQFAGWYDIRLKISQKQTLIHIPEFLYTQSEEDIRKSGEKQFDYVNPRNRQLQIEMERACTSHLKETGAWLRPVFNKIDLNEGKFPVEASVIIPVKNRVKTITDAIQSVIRQKANFKYNLIIIDNHSTDGTTGLIENFRRTEQRIIHIIPARSDLGIGGCWNEAIFHPLCGKFVIQLDSDDLYIDENVVSRMVNAFYEQKCAMLIGAYKMVNFRLQEIPPGIIDHKEWTPENGRNNALRINGLGAPRAFYTPVIRDIRFPNVSYGEDYMVGLNVSRYYQIGRIYDPVYLCRRWEENSDASLDIPKMNRYNYYKDWIRTIELKARKHLIANGREE